MTRSALVALMFGFIAVFAGCIDLGADGNGDGDDPGTPQGPGDGFDDNDTTNGTGFEAILEADTTGGTPPLAVTFSLDAHNAPNGTATWQLDFEGDGSFDDNGTTLPDESRFRYESNGTYAATLSVSAANETATTTLTITVGDGAGGPGNETGGNGTGNQTGNETGNQTGNETGNQTGNETGNETGNDTLPENITFQGTITGIDDNDGGYFIGGPKNHTFDWNGTVNNFTGFMVSGPTAIDLDWAIFAPNGTEANSSAACNEPSGVYCDKNEEPLLIDDLELLAQDGNWTVEIYPYMSAEGRYTITIVFG